MIQRNHDADPGAVDDKEFVSIVFIAIDVREIER